MAGVARGSWNGAQDRIPTPPPKPALPPKKPGTGKYLCPFCPAVIRGAHIDFVHNHIKRFHKFPEPCLGCNRLCNFDSMQIVFASADRKFHLLRCPECELPYGNLNKLREYTGRDLYPKKKPIYLDRMYGSSVNKGNNPDTGPLDNLVRNVKDACSLM